MDLLRWHSLNPKDPRRSARPLRRDNTFKIVTFGMHPDSDIAIIIFFVIFPYYFFTSSQNQLSLFVPHILDVDSSSNIFLE